MRRLATEAHGPLAVERTLRDEVAPLLLRVGPAAQERYGKEAARIFGISTKVVREIVTEVEASRPVSASSAPPPPSPDKHAVASDPQLHAADIGQIIHTHRGTEVVQYNPRERTKYGEVIFTGHIEIDRRVQLNGDGEVMVGSIACPDRGLRREVTLPPEAWESRVGFKRRLPTTEFGWFGTDNHLQQFMVHLSRSQARTVRGTRVLGLNERDGEWALVLTDKTLLRGGRETSDLIHYCDGETGVRWTAGDVSTPSPEDFRALMVHGLEFTATGKAAAIVGWMGALAWKARLAKRLTRKFPFLLLWGPKGCGKSSTAEQVLLRFYSRGQTPWSSVTQHKPFTAMLSASLTNLVPFVLDEYKGWSYLEAWQRSMLSQVIRDSYDGMAGKRGNRDARTQRLYPAVAPLVVAGEDTILEPAAQDRMVEVFLSPKDRQDRSTSWQALCELDLGALGLDYLRWSLDRTDEEMLALYREVEAALPDRMRDRVRHNVATAVFGLRMWTRWLAERGAPLPEEALDEHVKALVRLQMQTRYASKTATKPPSIVDRMLEYMAAAAENGVLCRGQDYELAEFDPRGSPQRLYLRLQKLFPRFKEWAIKTRYEEELISLDAFRKQLKEEPYFRDSNVAKWFALGPSGGGTKKAVVLDFAAMLAMGLDVDGFVSGEPKEVLPHE
jgi:hypothetical protein